MTVFVLAFAAVAFACNGGAGTTTATQTPTNPDEIIMSEQNVFSPAVLTVPAGTKVTWSNKSVRRWWVTTPDKKIDTGQIASGASVSYTFNYPGHL